jgi:CheY-like chemotaxis protein
MSKICLVEDDQDLANLTKTALVKNGHEVMLFHEARKAFEGIRLHKPDLILMDIMMPRMSGTEAVRILSKDPDLKNIPVIFLTALISEKDKDVEESGITIDGVNYKTLGKPYEIEQLLKMIGN